ncbi:uncharacterized protein CLAFUR5_04209 [Fulvia fulva]|uniref:GIT Spa2 homology (SHD) domain-containing protein n=1 Tax=Passalora fulva TaxID=5499 RepID=A0A9Q8LFJ0_PASFU|nr:uncharacterized protein CLAFUR5_04209 [Fulvia fulva]UJO16641.1 hypothetical protein CLAFUR5_04209 [Fulvia fulva]
MSRTDVGPSPLSPFSMSSNASDSVVGRYAGGSISHPAGTPNDVPYSGGPYGAARPTGSSPPSSQHPSGSTDLSRPSMVGSSVNGNRPPSTASSVGMSNDGRMGFGRPPPGNRDSGRSTYNPDGEEALSRHYAALKNHLAKHLQDETGNIRPNRARDKLLRLSVTQFMELSTDVYDELIRREDERMQRVDSVPRFLPPKQNFHPKRNQARQKLSTLPLERFRQLATDVFYELERRIPRFAGGNISRPRSTTSNASSRSQVPSQGGPRPPPGQYRYPPPGGRGRGYPPPSPYGPGPGGMMSPGPRRPSEAGSLGRPLPKHFQSSTIIPNKSIMVEDDEVEDDEDAFGLDHISNGISQRPDTGSAEDREKIQAQEMEISELKEKLASLETQKGSSEEERTAWTTLREELEQKNVDATTLVDSLQQELASFRSKSEDDDEIREQHNRNMQALQDQLEEMHERREELEQMLQTHQEENDNLRDQLTHVPQHDDDLKLLQVQIETHQAESEGLKRQLQARKDSMPSADHEQRIHELEEELSRQEKISNEVREEAMTYLREMRELSRRNDVAIEQEEKMAAKISQLEKDNDAWRQRYAKIKAQNKSLRASTMGLGLQTGLDTGSLVRQEGLISEGGLVRDTDVTRFQLSVDDLLKTARQQSTEAMLESVKAVVVSVQSITSAVRTDGYPSPAPSPSSPETNMQQVPSVGKLKARVTGTANSLITATKQHAASHGLSPVALLDAAASNLTASMVELIKAAKIRPSNKSELADLDAVDELGACYDDSLSPTGGAGPLSLQVPTIATATTTTSTEKTLPQPPQAEAKKGTGGWFGWAGKWNDDRSDDSSDNAKAGQQTQTPTSAAAKTNGEHVRVQPPGRASTTYTDDSDGEYDPYR